MVRAKFRVTRKTQFEPNDQARKPVEVVLTAVKSEPFGKYTPSGEVKMFIQNDDAESQFEVGKEYYVDFTPVTE